MRQVGASDAVSGSDVIDEGVAGDLSYRVLRCTDRQDRPTLGNTTVTLYITPSHTPGMVSALIPGTWNGQPHLLSFYGGTGTPASLGPTPYAGGLLEYRKSLARLTRLGIDAGADGVISDHPVSDDTPQKVAIVMSRGRSGPNP